MGLPLRFKAFAQVFLHRTLVDCVSGVKLSRCRGLGMK